MSMRVVVVGGGVTGLVAARALRERNVAVTLVERAFPFGGRWRPERVRVSGLGPVMFAPRPVVLGPDRYDAAAGEAPLGFPPLSLRAALFADGLPAPPPQLLITAVTTGDDFVPPSVLPTVAGGARGLIDRLLPRGYDPDLELLTGMEVATLEPDGRGWRVRVRECGPPAGDAPGRTLRADAVLLTQPVPEALALLDAGRVPLGDAVDDDLRRVRYARRLWLSVVGRGGGRGTTGVATLPHSPLEWLFDNHACGSSPAGPALTVSVRPRWAADHWGDPDEQIARRLLPLVQGWAGGEVVWHRVHRHEYDRPTVRVRMPFAEAANRPPLLFAGDAFADGVPNPLDAAYTSATHAAGRLCRVLGGIARTGGCRTPRTPSRTVVEVAVASAAEATLAVAGGADRLLLLAAPEVGGLTPTLDTFLATRSAAAAGGPAVPVTVLLRPRLGDCVYTPGEVEQVRRDARRFLRAGAAGIAFGAVTDGRTGTRVDAAACRPLVALAHGYAGQAVFHRAFDALDDRRTGLQDLITLGFDRVLTAGGGKLAWDGAAALAADVAYAGWDIDVVAVGGIGPEMAGYVVADTGCPGVLIGPRRTSPARARPPRHPFAHQRLAPLDAERVAATVAALRRAGRHNDPPAVADGELTPRTAGGAGEGRPLVGTP